MYCCRKNVIILAAIFWLLYLLSSLPLPSSPPSCSVGASLLYSYYKYMEQNEKKKLSEQPSKSDKDSGASS